MSVTAQTTIGDGHQIEKFFELSIEMLCVCGLDGYFKRVNPRWSQVLGFTEDEILSAPFMSFVHPDDRAATVEGVADADFAGWSGVGDDDSGGRESGDDPGP